MGAGTREAERLARQQEEALEEQPTPLPWKIGEGGTHLYYIDDEYESGKTEDHNPYHDTVIVEGGKDADIELIHKAVSIHAQLVDALRKSRRSHYHCEMDGWYSCPLSEDGCQDPGVLSDVCNCGADAHNLIIDGALEAAGVEV